MSSQVRRRISADRMPEKAADGDERQDAGICGKQDVPHLLGVKMAISVSGSRNDSLCSAAVLRSGWRYSLPLGEGEIVTSVRRRLFLLTGPSPSSPLRNRLMSAAVTSPMFHEPCRRIA
jgi:hypothetical protein